MVGKGDAAAPLVQLRRHTFLSVVGRLLADLSPTVHQRSAGEGTKSLLTERPAREFPDGGTSNQLPSLRPSATRPMSTPGKGTTHLRTAQ